MNARIGLRAGSLTAGLACALLVACGGGGGGTNITPQSSPTPTTAPTPTIAPTAQATIAPLSQSSTTAVTLGGVSNNGTNVVSAGTVTLPAAGVAGVTANVGLSATLPSAIPTPQAARIHFRKPQNIGVAYTAIAYFSVNLSQPITISSTPAFSITFPGTISGNCYVVVYDPTQPSAGWNSLLGPATASNGTLTFPANTITPSITLQANQTYYFGIITTGSQTIPTPMPTLTPTPTPTATPTSSSSPTSAPTGGASPLPTIGASGNGWAPYQVANAFQFPVMSGYNGAGQTVVIIGDNAPNASDYQFFQTYFQTAVAGNGQFSVVSVNGNNVSDNPNGEGTLDVETVMALAPGANIEFYTVSSLSNASFTQAYAQAISDTNHPHVFSISFGGCENNYTNTTQDTTLAQGAAAGIAYVASSGDQGDECYVGGSTPFQFGVNSPASDPNVIGVGGNETYGAPLNNPVAWNDTFFSSGQGATGGGISGFFTPPPAQSGIAHASVSWRSVPDVAMPAVDVSIRLGGKWAEYGGTSWSAPQMAAMLATLDQYCGGSLGANPINWIYTAFKRSPSNFIDVTSGNNQFGTDSTYYTAGPGYDMTTGVGMPLGMPIAQSICANHTPAAGYRPESRGAIVPTDSYGAARDTVLPAAPRNYVQDLGARPGSASTEVTVVMRATATIALDESKVIASLRNAGFQITKTYPNHLVVVASAPASVVNTYFRTQLHDVNQGGRIGTRHVNITPATLPAEIAPYVKGALMDDLDVYKPM